MDVDNGVKVIKLELLGIDPAQAPGDPRFSHSKSFPSTEQIKSAVDEYITALESDYGAKWCRCEWEKFELFGKVRMRIKDTNPTCPVHSREGLILFFFEWLLGAGQDKDESA